MLHLGDASLFYDSDGLIPVGLFGGDCSALTSGSFETDVIDAIFFCEFHIWIMVVE